MNPKDLLLQIGSVTIAAAALLGTQPSQAGMATGTGAGQAIRAASDAVAARRETELQAESKKLVLTPAPSAIILARGHSSHSSHRSHSSHYSGSGRGGSSSPAPSTPGSGGSSSSGYATPRGSNGSPQGNTPSPGSGFGGSSGGGTGIPTPTPSYRSPEEALAATGSSVSRNYPKEGQNLREFKLEKWDLNGAKLANANGMGVNFKEALLVRAELEEANLSGADFTGAKMDGANLKNANLSKATLKNAHMNGVDLCWANLEEADLEGADLTNALYNSKTRWPKGFDPKAHHVIFYDR